MSRQALPAEGCKATKEDLKEEGLKLADGCPVCLKLGVECFVSNHPLEAKERELELERIKNQAGANEIFR